MIKRGDFFLSTLAFCVVMGLLYQAVHALNKEGRPTVLHRKNSH